MAGITWYNYSQMGLYTNLKLGGPHCKRWSLLDHLDAAVRSTMSACWAVGPPRPEKMMDFVNWDDDIPNSHGKIQKMATKPPTSLSS